MKKHLFIITLIMMLFLVCANAKTKKKYLALGDSITAGYSLEEPEKDCYAKLFADKYDLDLTNEAVSGDKSKVLLEKLANYNIDDYDVITICIGANDILRDFIEKFQELTPTELATFIGNLEENEEFNNQINKNLEELDSNLKKIMDIIQKGHAQIYMMNVYNPYNDNAIPSMENIADPYIKKLNEVIEKYAKKVNFVNLYKAFDKKTGIINSQTLKTIYDPHPNTEGHKVIYNVLSDEYYKNNAETINIILLITFGIVALLLEAVEVIYTSKKFVVKPIIREKSNEKIEEKEEKKQDSSRFIRS